MNPLVSILINNYNYGRYLGAAIGSALAQTWKPLEVIVVDDGSIDNSAQVIERYRGRVEVILQPNGGQGAAYNAGFAASHGEWVLFLDSDDLLDADAIERMMALAQRGVAKVQGYLERIGPDGEPLDGTVPYMTHDGDVREIARRFRQYASPPGSGNLFRRKAIEPYFPLVPGAWRRSADTVPILLCVFHGRVATVAGPIGSYRLHVKGNLQSGVLGNIDRSLAEALRNADNRRHLVQAWGTARTGQAWPDEWVSLPWDWRVRAMSWRLQRASHPYPQDTRGSIWRGLNDALDHWPGYNVAERLLLRAWLLAMLWAPSLLVGAVARNSLSGGLRARLRRLRGGWAA